MLLHLLLLLATAAPQLTKPPRLVEQPEPVYPAEALAVGLSADVTLQIDIDAKGLVTAVVVTRPAGNGFDEAAQEAARAMRFEPAEIDGKPGAIRIEYVMHFRPNVRPVEATPPPPPPPPPAKAVLVRGRLREKGTRDPIAAADVTLVRAGDEAAVPVAATTDDEGTFSVEGEPGGHGKLVVTSADHEICVRELDLPAAGVPPIEVQCTVARRDGPRYETVVRKPSEGADATQHTVSRTEMTTVPGTFGDPLRVIQTLPGVARMPYGLGLLVIRGSSPQDSGVYVDGHRVPILYHFLGGPSVLTPDLIDRIDFYPGGFGVRYGRATAGVVDVATRSEAPTRVHGAADVDFLDSSAMLEGPLGGGFGGQIAARRSYIDLLLPLFIPRSEGSSTALVSPIYWDYQARVARPIGNSGRLSLFAFGSEDSLKVSTSDPERGNIDLGTRIGFHRVIGTYLTAIGPWTSRFSPSWGHDQFVFTSGEIGGRGSAHVLGLREELGRQVLPSLKLAAGIDSELRFDEFAFDLSLPPERRTYGRTERVPTHIERSQRNMSSGFYAEALWDLRPDLRIVPGLRLDWFHLGTEDRVSLDPRVVIRWARTPTQAFKVGTGIFHQAPQPQQMDAEFGNPKLSLLWADQYHAGIEQGITGALSLDATVYFSRRHALPIASAREVDGRIERYASAGRGRSYGLELRLKHAVSDKFYGWISYTLARSEVVLSRPVDPDDPPRPYRPTDFDQTHNFILVASRRLGAWELGTRFRVVSGIPETPIVGATYDADYDRYDPILGPRNSERRQTFHQLDLRVERTFIFDAWRFSIYLDVQNVYNAENPEATLDDYRYRQSAPLRGLPILPVLGLKGRF